MIVIKVVYWFELCGLTGALVCTTYILAFDAQLWSPKVVVDDKGEGRVN